MTEKESKNPNEGLLFPKFLTKEIAEKAALRVLESVSSQFKELDSKDGHVVILIPSMKDDRKEKYPKWPDYPLSPYLLYEHSVGNPKEWQYEYKDIAECKALQLWTDRNDDRIGIIPHLLFPGDTVYSGGVKRSGIVVAYSGAQEYFDKMISGMIADSLVALAHHEWINSKENKESLDFLE